MPPSTRRSRQGQETGTPSAKRLVHRCGHFLGELRDGTLYVACGRCKELVALVSDTPSTDPRIIKSNSKVQSTVT